MPTAALGLFALRRQRGACPVRVRRRVLECDVHDRVLLAAGVGVRGLPDHGQPDGARIEQATREHLGATRFTEVTLEGGQADWRELVAATLTR